MARAGKVVAADGKECGNVTEKNQQKFKQKVGDVVGVNPC